MLSRTRFVMGLAMICAIGMLAVMAGSQAQQSAGTESGASSLGLGTSVPRTMSYQGVLNDSNGDPVRNTTLNVTFRIFDAYTGGNQLWTEVVQIETDQRANFTATLPDMNLPFDEDYYLELQIEGDPQPLEPRQKLHMVPYAARADTSDFAFAGGGWVDDGTTVRLETSTDNVGIGTSNPGTRLVVHDLHTGRIEFTQVQYPVLKIIGDRVGIGGYGVWHSDDTEQSSGWFSGLDNGGKYTIGYGPNWVAAKDSPTMTIHTNGNVGVGMTAPSEKLDVNGNAHITGDLIVDGSVNFPSSGTFDSGWFPVAPNSSYTYPHNLGTVKMLITLFGATDMNGADMSTLATPEGNDGQNKMATVGQITTTHFTLRVGIHQLGHIWDSSNWVTATHARIIALALE